METAYFDTSVFLAVLNGEDDDGKIRELLRELKKNRVRAYTSIITLQEMSVLSYRRGKVADDMVGKLHKLARIVGITKEMALTAAKLEAQIKDSGKKKSSEEQIAENRRRKWDCFHIAAAMCLKATTIYSFDSTFLKRKAQLDISELEFSLPVPKEPTFNFQPEPKAQRNPSSEGEKKESSGLPVSAPQADAKAPQAQASTNGSGEPDGPPVIKSETVSPHSQTEADQSKTTGKDPSTEVP